MALAAAILWLLGLGWFVESSLAIRDDGTALADAIVVLTGGKMRLETGVALLAAGRGKALFISGVNPQVERGELLHALGPVAGREACCIALGRQADNTAGNARETAGWMQEQGYMSLRLVTGWYHMRRALLEFRRAMPQMTIVPHPVFAPPADPNGWWGRHGEALLVVGEYNKYLAAAAWLRPIVDAIARSPVPTGEPALTRTSATTTPSTGSAGAAK